MTTGKKKAWPKWAEAFLDALSNDPRVLRAAKEAGVTRQAAYYLRDRDESFAKAWEKSRAVGWDKLEDNLVAVGLGEKKASAQEVTASIFMLKAHRREVYGEGRVSVNVHTDNSPDAVGKAIRTALTAMDQTVPDQPPEKGNGKA